MQLQATRQHTHLRLVAARSTAAVGLSSLAPATSPTAVRLLTTRAAACGMRAATAAVQAILGRGRRAGGIEVHCEAAGLISSRLTVLFAPGVGGREWAGVQFCASDEVVPAVPILRVN